MVNLCSSHPPQQTLLLITVRLPVALTVGVGTSPDKCAAPGHLAAGEITEECRSHQEISSGQYVCGAPAGAY